MGSQDHAAGGGADAGHGGLPVVIGVAPALADRVRLAELLHGFGPVGLVFVSTVDEARLLLDGAAPATGRVGGTMGAGGDGGAGPSTGNGNARGDAGGNGQARGDAGGNGYVRGDEGSNGHARGDAGGNGYVRGDEGGNGHAAVPPATGRRLNRLAGLMIDSDLLLASRNGHRVGLTPLEHDLLLRLGSEPRQTWTHAQLHESVWNTRHVGGHADIHSVVKRLRRKLAALGTSASITAVRGVGFRLADGSDAPDGTAG